jgi:hypothetical protein
MTEDGPFPSAGDLGPTRLPLKGPNVNSTFDTPPSPDALRAQDAAMRRHLQNRRPEPPAPEDRAPRPGA